MSNWKLWLGILVIVAAFGGAALAGAKDGADPKAPGENATTARPATSTAPKGTVSAAGANVIALLGVLVMKGVLEPSEASAIRDAAPDAEFQMLVDVLARKGVLSAEELAPVAVPVAARRAYSNGTNSVCSAESSRAKGSSSSGSVACSSTGTRKAGGYGARSEVEHWSPSETLRHGEGQRDL